jgi:hypothetical protein
MKLLDRILRVISTRMSQVIIFASEKGQAVAESKIDEHKRAIETISLRYQDITTAPNACRVIGRDRKIAPR